MALVAGASMGAGSGPGTAPGGSSTSGSGQDQGSDTYSDSDRGSETDVLSATGAMDATGQFKLVSLMADISGSAQASGSDSGTDTVTTSSLDSDVDQSSDQETDTETYAMHLTGDANSASVSRDENVTGDFNTGDTDTRNWDDPLAAPTAGGSSGEDAGNETDTRSDQAHEAIVTHATGSVDSQGNYTETGATADVTGNDHLGEQDGLTDDARSGGGETQESQQGTVSGQDGYHVTVARSAGGGLSVTDDESINEQVGLNASKDAMQPAETDHGSGDLSGTVSGSTHQTGSTQAGQFVTDPASGNLSVNLGGDCHDDDVRAVANDHYLPYPGGSVAGALVPTSSTVETVLDDQGMQIQESDAETAGAWSAGPITYADHPRVTTTTTYNYGTVVGVLDQDLPATGSGTDTLTHSESTDVSETGTGASLHGTETKVVTDTEVRDLTWSSARGSGTQHYDSNVRVTDTIAGDEQSPSSDNFTDTTQTHREFHSNSVWNYTNAPNANGQVTQNVSSRDDFLGDSTSVETLSNGADALVSLSGGGNENAYITGRSTGPGGMEVTTTTYSFTITDQLLDGVSQPKVDPSGHYDATGNDPVTGAPVDVHQPYNPLNPPRIESGDWFSRLADFSAGMADQITAGLTRRIRQGLDLDGVNYNSGAYGTGSKVGFAVDVLLSPINPCGKARWLANSIRGLSAINATGQMYNAGDAFVRGDMIGFADAFFSARGGFGKLGNSCFTAGTPLLTPDGARPIDQLREGDLVLSRSEHDPDGPVHPRRVAQTFVRVAPILNLHVAGRIIETTREHPFYVDGDGWRPACELRAGDRLVGHDGVRAAVEGVADSGRVETVYNVEVEDDHTYFVGGAEWGWSVWAHNANYRIAEDGTGRAYLYLENIATPISFANRAAAVRWANNAGHTLYSVPLSPPAPFPGTVMMPISNLQPSPAALAQQPAALASKLIRQGFFNWNKYLPIQAWVKNGVWYFDNGMTRIANAQTWGITHLPVKRVSPP